MRIFEEQIHFEWDKGNRDKNFHKHQVSVTESEEAFFDKNNKVFYDIKHSTKEKRYINYGRTKQERYLITIFTKRKDNIRIISSRDMKKKERITYEKRINLA